MDHGFEAPVRPGVRFHDLLVVSLGGNGRFEHVVNGIRVGTAGAVSRTGVRGRRPRWTGTAGALLRSAPQGSARPGGR